VVLRIRKHLERQAVGLIGAPTIQHELRAQRLITPIPSLSVIKRILHDAQATHQSIPLPAQGFYPHPYVTGTYPVQAIDWTEKYLEGGTKVYAFHALDLDTWGCHQTLSRQKDGATTRRHLLESWEKLGIPAGLQMDNDAVFNGGNKVPRCFGKLVRLCLYLGVEPIFIPVREPKRNGEVEWLNGFWGGDAFWHRHYFRTWAQVQRTSPIFEHWYWHVYQPPALQGQTPAQAWRQRSRRMLTAAQARHIPESLPLTAGRIHFIRRVDEHGDIKVLNESWHIHKRLVNRYVWATLWPQRQILEIHYRPSENQSLKLFKTFSYPIAETVVPVLPKFQPPLPRRKMSTMS
jgi:hypothetical protein